MSTPDLHDRYVMYLLGELSNDDAAAVESELEADEAARGELETARQMLAELDAVLGAPGGADALADRIVAGLDTVKVRRAPIHWYWWVPLAAAACILLALGVWRIWPTDRQPTIAQGDPPPQDIEDPPRPVAVQLASWKVTPTGGADFQVIHPTLVRLDRGELLVESTEGHLGMGDVAKTSLHIKTPHGEVVAKGTRFYVGTHKPTERGERAMFAPLTRVLVLSGVVTLSTAIGSIEGTAGDLLAAEADKAPTKLVVQANSDFAFDLYQQLAKESEGKNLFFSPYSVSGALAMTAEGAREETAAEMGKVLRFPDAAKRLGDDAQLIPWETSLIHTGMSELNRKLNAMDEDPTAIAETRAKIAELRKELETVKANVAQLKTDGGGEYFAAVNKEREIAAKLYAESSTINQYEIRVANALWGEKTHPFDQKYIETVNRHYDTGGVFPVDFKYNFEAERLNINGWVEEQTNDRIVDLLPEGSLTKDTRLVLANAIYFKGDWSVPFTEEFTKDRDFTLAGGGKQQTAIMHAPKLEAGRYAAFNADGSHFDTPMRIRRGQDPKELYPKGDGFAIVELPYKGDDLSMVVIAPNDPTGLSAIEEKLTPENVNAWIGRLKKRETNVYLPKFKMETDYKLGDAGEPATLQKMGMVRAFVSPADLKTPAQFQGMTTSTDPMDQLYISKVIHKAFVEVNEKGTEAAAATAVVMDAMSSVPRDYPFTPEFKADRPFVFLVREKSTGSILFLGRMTQPAS